MHGSYYHGNTLVAQRKGQDSSYILSFIHQDSLSSTSVVSDNTGSPEGSVRYTPFGETYGTTGTIPTDKLFTGQRLDSTGLYYYGARYYDPEIGRFISADMVVQSLFNPQCLNRYSYCLNNPLKYTDPSGHEVYINGYNMGQVYADTEEYDFNIWQQYTKLFESDLFQAYDILRGVASELTNYLESSQDKIYVAETQYTSNIAEFRAGDYGTHSLLVNPIVGKLQESGILSNAQFAGILGHEFFHGAIRIGTEARDKFGANEAFAYSFGAIVEQELGGKGAKPISVEINPWLPSGSLNKNLSTSAEQLYDFAPKAYSQGWWFWRRSLNNWSKQDPLGDKFLTVAKAVWIQ